MGNVQVHISSGFLMSLAGDCVVWDNPGYQYSYYSTVNVGYNPTDTDLLENNCSLVSAISYGRTEQFVMLGMGPGSSPNGSAFFIAGGNGSSIGARKKRSAPEWDSRDHVAYSLPIFISHALLTYHDYNATTSDVTVLVAENFTTDENGGIALIHKDINGPGYTCLASIDNQLVFNYQGDEITNQNLLDHCKNDKARWYLRDTEIAIEHEGFLVNENGNCIAANDTLVSVFNSTGVTNLTEVTFGMANNAGCKLLTLVEEDPSIGAFHIEENGTEWHLTAAGKSLEQVNGTVLTVYQRTYGNDVLFSVDEAQIYRPLSDYEDCLMAFGDGTLSIVALGDCEGSGAGKWVFLKEEEEETTTESKATPLTSHLGVNILMLWLVALFFSKL